MLLKASEFHFPDAVRAKYFPLVIRASPPEGWPRRTIMMSENKVPYRVFLQIIGASPASEFEAEIGEYQDNDPRITSMLEEIALNCPLREDEAAESKRIRDRFTEADEKDLRFSSRAYLSYLLCFRGRHVFFSSALVLSLYTMLESSGRSRLGLLDKSPEAR
jgi:hypothetical protein